MIGYVLMYSEVQSSAHALFNDTVFRSRCTYESAAFAAHAQMCSKIFAGIGQEDAGVLKRNAGEFILLKFYT